MTRLRDARLAGPRPRPAPAGRSLTTALMVSARADPAIEELPVGASQEALALVMTKAVARRAVLDWEGVGDDAGNIVPVTAESIDSLLEIWPAFEALQAQYVARGLLLHQVKNASAPSPPVVHFVTPTLTALGEASHGSVLSGNYAPTRGSTSPRGCRVSWRRWKRMGSSRSSTTSNRQRLNPLTGFSPNDHMG